MRLRRTEALLVLSAATIVAAFGLSGCSPGSTAAPSTSPAATAAVASSRPDALPPATALTDVLGRLADPAVPGSEKLPLVEGATAGEAANLDGFAKALQDNRMLPLTFAATDLAWSPEDPGNVTATVNVTPSDPGLTGFSFPMEFKPIRGEAGNSETAGGWQLSRQTADLLLVFGANGHGSTDPAAPAPTPPP